MKKSSKAQHTQLSIGKKPGSGSKDAPLFLMICTAKDRNGTKFMVISYIVQRFCKCNHHTAGFSVILLLTKLILIGLSIFFNFTCTSLFTGTTFS
jgi:hypothetical protein